ncbi:Alg9-like mannosyltransferase family-domain containing protein [Nitzschia inconspicua]|uniref:Mannosyltransferase n=1 Tax=Nitzschia inconspicua TaxID=303405 RepID=A0A9K3Q6H7_9STRA|nr:Alg9-like mannosyltransferase family-domain containing protein [Nitzschia inconspicua]
MAVRISLANRMPIMDCDESFNYWEPLHFLLYSNGYQTWEYSNTFALRTYAYLMPLVGLSKGLDTILLSGTDLSWLWPLLTEQQVAGNDKLALFVLLRATLGAWMAWAELSFVRAIAEHDIPSRDTRQRRSFLRMVALVTQVLMLTSAGMGHASAALLPSSTLMGLWLFAAGAFLRRQHTQFIVLAVTATLAVGWPFGVALFVPLGLAVLAREYSHPESSMMTLYAKIGVITGIIQGLVMVIDYRHYGRWVSPVWNILVYNTQAGGDELYGIEPLSYYIKNILLNFNYVAVIGLMGTMAAPLLLASNDLTLLLLPMLTWIVIVAPRPHKEERFLFPIYPAICLGAAILSVYIVQKLTVWWSASAKKNPTRTATVFSIILLGVIWGPAVLISSSRIAALMKYYSAPLKLYAELPAFVKDPHDSAIGPISICTCGEWYRFPSSFYIPHKSLSFGFAPSKFGGQLPQPFTSYGSGAESAALRAFNDKNKPEPGSYTTFQNCDFLVELSTSVDSCTESLEEGYEWQVYLQEPFLNADNTSTLHRSLYIPRLHEKAILDGKVAYADFSLYAKRKSTVND